MLRPAGPDDLPFLRDLYATTRTGELAAFPWPDAAKHAFLDQQFAAQHRHFTAVFAAADFVVVTRRGRPVGRLYLDRAGPLWRIVDIALLPALHGTGAGTALLRWVQGAARAATVEGVDLHVLSDNPGAARLYARLGFTAVTEPVTPLAAAGAVHRRMIWRIS